MPDSNPTADRSALDRATLHALDALLNDLRQAVGYPGRGGAYQAQLAVATFLKSCQFPQQHQMLFVDLAVALKDLENGIVDPMLAKPKGKPNYRDPQRLWQARKNVAVILDTLKRCGMPRKDAVRLVRSRLDRLDSLVSSKSVKDIDSTIDRWRTQLATGAVKLPEIVQSYEYGRRNAQMAFSAIFREGERSASLASLSKHPNLEVWLSRQISEINEQIDRLGL